MSENAHLSGNKFDNVCNCSPSFVLFICFGQTSLITTSLLVHSSSMVVHWLLFSLMYSTIYLNLSIQEALLWRTLPHHIRPNTVPYLLKWEDRHVTGVLTLLVILISLHVIPSLEFCSSFLYLNRWVCLKLLFKIIRFKNIDI